MDRIIIILIHLYIINIILKLLVHLDFYTYSLHVALPISQPRLVRSMVEYFVPTIPFASYLLARWGQITGTPENCRRLLAADRKSTRLNSSHANISYSVFCVKKKKYLMYTLACPPGHMRTY